MTIANVTLPALLLLIGIIIAATCIGVILGNALYFRLFDRADEQDEDES